MERLLIMVSLITVAGMYGLGVPRQHHDGESVHRGDAESRLGASTRKGLPQAVLHVDKKVIGRLGVPIDNMPRTLIDSR